MPICSTLEVKLLDEQQRLGSGWFELLNGNEDKHSVKLCHKAKVYTQIDTEKRNLDCNKRSRMIQYRGAWRALMKAPRLHQ